VRADQAKGEALRVSIFFALLLLAVPAAAQTETQPTGLPLPRFASLRADEVNVRTGPGPRYPVEWVFVRRNMPVEIVAEFDTWRRIRDWQGTEGWAHKSMLSGRRTVMMQGEVRTLRREPTKDSPAVARAEPGVVGNLEACDNSWCRIEVGGFEGWLKLGEFWGVYPDERID
jgi:SH3-like domain-containing protein